MALQNGQLDDVLLTSMPNQPGARLTIEAARSWGRLIAEVREVHGWTPTITSVADAYRSYEIQERIFLQRYTQTYNTGINYSPPRTKYWNGRVWYLRKGLATAATPGTSNHGLGVACDVTGLGGFTSLRYREFKPIANKHGWDNIEGTSIGEPWHWVYKPALDHVAKTVSTAGGGTILTPGGSLPNPLEPEDFMATVDQKEWEEVVQRIKNAESQTTTLLRLFDAEGILSAALARLDKGWAAEDGDPEFAEHRKKLDWLTQMIADIHGGVAGIPALLVALGNDDVDPEKLASAIVPLIAANTTRLSDEDLLAVAKAVNDEAHKRSAD